MCEWVCNGIDCVCMSILHWAEDGRVGGVGDGDKGGSSDTCVGTTAVMFWGLLCLNEINGMSDISEGLLGSQRHERA